jgi:superfamily II DNA or RNA helicase
MIKITKIVPSFIKLEGVPVEQEKDLEKFLSYTDKKAVFLYNKARHNKNLARRMDREDFLEYLERLKKAQKVSLLKRDRKGNIYTFSGLLKKVESFFSENSIKYIDNTEYPEPENLPFKKDPPQLRYYQQEAVDALIKARHGAISVCTGGGKSLILLSIAKEFGLKTVVMCPSASIASQLYETFLEYLGKKYVGLFGSGKKEINKLITIAIDKSLINVEKGTEEWEVLSKTQVAIVDESHMVATETQEVVMTGVFRDSPYRFFLSATQFRNDGADLLLEGIIGDVVYDFPIEKGIKEGFLAEPTFYIIPVRVPEGMVFGNDPLQNLRTGVYENKALHEYAAKIANRYLASGKKVMIMIDQVDQFSLLVNHLSERPGFAYGSLTKEQKSKIDKMYYAKSTDMVDKFNDGKLNCLVGTTAIGMGTDTRPVDVIINLQGGQSDVKFLQLIGRGTRKVPGKKEFVFIDFDVVNHDLLHKWALSRKSLFKQVHSNVFVVDSGV